MCEEKLLGLGLATVLRERLEYARLGWMAPEIYFGPTLWWLQLKRYVQV